MDQRFIEGCEILSDERTIQEFVNSGQSGGVSLTLVVTQPQLALSGSIDNTLRLWDLEHGKQLRAFRHSGWVWCLSVDWSVERALTGSEDCNLRLWDLERGEAIRLLKGHSKPVLCLAADW